jgi:hypothetical protein
MGDVATVHKLQTHGMCTLKQPMNKFVGRKCIAALSGNNRILLFRLTFAAMKFVAE